MDASEFALSEEIIQSLSSGGDLDGVMSSEIFPRDSLYMENGDNEADDIIICHMDIREPLRQLQTILEDKLSISLDGYSFVLQETQELEPHKNLVDQCVKGKGLVQINVQIQTTAQRINIVDVLKPTENALAAMEENRGKWSLGDNEPDDLETEESDVEMAGSPTETSNDKHVLNWVLDMKFKKEQIRLNIPEDPNEWTIPQVRHWFQWAVRQFDLTDLKMSDWAITGQELCSLTHEEFCKKLPSDPGNVFWTHLQLLKECKFVSVVHESMENGSPEHSSHNGDPPVEDHAIFRPKDAKRPTVDTTPGVKEFKIMRKQISSGMDSPVNTVISTSHSNGGNVASNNNNNNTSSNASAANSNGQCQLWQFLLEILTDREHVDIIQWVGNDGEFKLTDPESVARLWGIKKNKPAMNYEKLSRALRYYYDGDMISKVSGKRFAYKFDCDLKLLIGYDAAELSRLVNKKSLTQKSAYQEHLNMKSDED